jgi:hypothetical protein
MTQATYPADIRQQVAEFAEKYPTPNVRRAVNLAQAGTITWEAVYDLFRTSLGTALVEVAKPEPVAPRAGLVQCPNGCGHWVKAGVYIDPDLPCP